MILTEYQLPGLSLTGTNCGLDSASPSTGNRTNQPPTMRPRTADRKFSAAERDVFALKRVMLLHEKRRTRRSINGRNDRRFRVRGFGAAAVGQAQPAPFPDYHWCPGQWWDPGWGANWDGGRCHDDHWYDGEGRDQGHWHNGPWNPNWH
jgi:hypothetical protein